MSKILVKEGISKVVSFEVLILLNKSDIISGKLEELIGCSGILGTSGNLLGVEFAVKRWRRRSVFD